VGRERQAKVTQVVVTKQIILIKWVAAVVVLVDKVDCILQTLVNKAQEVQVDQTI
tara:strand:+ start:293 stop:457 length:165 start_codon:yes stop_codon:yes gene_type:complete